MFTSHSLSAFLSHNLQLFGVADRGIVIAGAAGAIAPTVFEDSHIDARFSHTGLLISGLFRHSSKHLHLHSSIPKDVPA